MKIADLKTLAKHENEYVALSPENSSILAAGKTIKELENKLEKLQAKNATIQYIGPLDKFLSPLCL